VQAIIPAEADRSHEELPDWILGLGYIDDAALIGWTMNTVKSDIDGFREWESRKSDG
jgi:uncharacterized membrane protein YkvA (DUF1232 family)